MSRAAVVAGRKALQDLIMARGYLGRDHVEEFAAVVVDAVTPIIRAETLRLDAAPLAERRGSSGVAYHLELLAQRIERGEA